MANRDNIKLFRREALRGLDPSSIFYQDRLDNVEKEINTRFKQVDKEEEGIVGPAVEDPNIDLSLPERQRAIIDGMIGPENDGKAMFNVAKKDDITVEPVIKQKDYRQIVGSNVMLEDDIRYTPNKEEKTKGPQYKSEQSPTPQKEKIDLPEGKPVKLVEVFMSEYDGGDDLG